jgi:hypothetical protein
MNGTLMPTFGREDPTTDHLGSFRTIQTIHASEGFGGGIGTAGGTANIGWTGRESCLIAIITVGVVGISVPEWRLHHFA